MKYGDRPMLIGGELVTTHDGDWITSVSPATGESIGRVPAGTKAHVDQATAAALAAQPAWAALSIWERGAKLRALADAIRARSDDIKRMEAEDSGNTIASLSGDLHKAAHHFEYFAGLATEMKGDTVPASANGLHMTLREPYGVVGRIVPFNHPFMFATANLAAPLVAGNTVVLKSPETSPLTATVMAELCQAHLPKGVVNLISGFGLPVGDAIARHPQIRRIGFTGSISTGLAIQRAAAEVAVKNVTLELGGKNPLIICRDADLTEAVRGAIAGMNFAWAGQSCGSTSRILVHESVYDRAVEMAKAEVERIKVGDPLDFNSQMGPLNSAAHFGRVTALVSAAKSEGARLVTGGGQPVGVDPRGFWLQPTIFAGVAPEMRIAREEVFGPVMSFIRWSTEDEVIRLANSTPYGLTAAIYGRDIKTVLAMAKQIDAGVIAINGTKMHFVGLPFGGVKDSGIGGEECLEELLSYTRVKAVHILM